jgi:transposase
MPRPPKVLVLSDADRATLTRYARGHNTRQNVARRAYVLLGAADGVPMYRLADEVGVSRMTAFDWRNRYDQDGIASLTEMQPGRGRKSTLAPGKVEEIVDATLHKKPEGETHWTCRSMAKAYGVSHSTVQRIWDAHGLQPHRVGTFKLSSDKKFVEKLTDVVGLYHSPPDKAVVLCVDEKSQVQALDRTQPSLPMKKGRCGTMTHDYKRNGTTTLFAALNMLDGSVIGECLPRHRHQEFLKFLRRLDKEFPKSLDLHLIVDNYGTHTHPNVKAWLAKHPRFILHFTPTSSSWLNMIERWFREITQKRIRRGTFTSVEELIKAIEQYIQHHNKDAKPFVWTATVDSIMAKINKCKVIYETLH